MAEQIVLGIGVTTLGLMVSGVIGLVIILNKVLHILKNIENLTVKMAEHQEKIADKHEQKLQRLEDQMHSRLNRMEGKKVGSIDFDGQ